MQAVIWCLNGCDVRTSLMMTGIWPRLLVPPFRRAIKMMCNHLHVKLWIPKSGQPQWVCEQFGRIKDGIWPSQDFPNCLGGKSYLNQDGTLGSLRQVFTYWMFGAGWQRRSWGGRQATPCSREGWPELSGHWRHEGSRSGGSACLPGCQSGPRILWQKPPWIMWCANKEYCNPLTSNKWVIEYLTSRRLPSRSF